MPRPGPGIDFDDFWRILLEAVERLHERGLTGIRALPYHGAVGYWRLEITTADNLVSGVELPPRDDDAVFRVTGAELTRIGELPVSPATTVDEVADEILRGLGSPLRTTYRNDREYCRWFAGMRREAEEIGMPPSAFEDYHHGWRCGTTDIAPPPGWEESR